ncbi:MAG: FtsX-like permease family protein [Cyclobacteriaceae bacterium]
MAHPPNWPLRFLSWFCPDQLLEEIEGDLFQKFEKDVEQLGLKKAKRKFIWNSIRYFRLGIVLRNTTPSINSSILIANNFKFAWRNLNKHKIFSFVNIIGLSVSMAVCLIITNYVVFEKSYELFNINSTNIYRVSYSRFIDGEFQYSKAQVYPAVGETLKETVPEIRNYTRIFPATNQNEAVLSINVGKQQKIFAESSIFAVDSTFLRIFTIPLIKGDENTALSNQNGFVLSESTARKFFGDEDPIGKMIHWKDMGDWQVTGVFKDLPQNSHMEFDILTSWMPPYGERSLWNWDGFYTYILLNPNSNIQKIEPLIQSVLEDKTSKRHDPSRIKSTFFLQPLHSIHLNSHLSGELQTNGSGKVVMTLQIVAFIILILAIINYFNLSIARSIQRAKEVGVRKIIGSTRTQLTWLFFAESLLFNVISLILSIAIFTFSNQAFNDLVSKPIEPLIWAFPVTTGLYLVLIIIVVSALSAFYPARLMAANPLRSIGKISNRYYFNSSIRKSLLAFQFLITIIMVIGTLIIREQISFMQNQHLGFAKNQNLIVKSYAGPFAERDSSILHDLSLFKEKVKSHSIVRNATITSNIPGIENSWVGRLRKSETDEDLITASRTRVDTDFIDTYGLQLIAGNNFSSEKSGQIILNQSAIKVFGYNQPEDALGVKVMGDHEIVGVINDYHEQSLNYPIMPAMYTPGQGYLKYVTINIKSGNFNSAVSEIQEEWKNIFPELPFDYFFLDDFFNLQYQQEKQLTKVFAYFSGIGIFIACLGLFGFTYYVSHQRIKEIGIRKTLGASLFNLLKLLTSEFLLLVLVAGAVAIPLSHYLSTQWLSNYMVRIEPGFLLYLLPVFLIGTLAFLSTLFLLLKVIKINPSESLKYDS